MPIPNAMKNAANSPSLSVEVSPSSQPDRRQDDQDQEAQHQESHVRQPSDLLSLVASRRAVAEDEGHQGRDRERDRGEAEDRPDGAHDRFERLDAGGVQGVGSDVAQVDRADPERGDDDPEDDVDHDGRREPSPPGRRRRTVREQGDEQQGRSAGDQGGPVRDPRGGVWVREAAGVREQRVDRVLGRADPDQERDPDRHQEPADRVRRDARGHERAHRHVPDHHHDRQDHEQAILRERAVPDAEGGRHAEQHDREAPDHPREAAVPVHERGSSAGTVPVTVVPSPGALRTRTSPPIASSRSAIPWSPVPCATPAASNPIPSSTTVNVRVPFA